MALTFVGGNTNTGTGATYSVSLTALTGGSDSAAAEGDIVVVATGWVDISNTNPGVTSPADYTEIADLYRSDTRDANLSVSYKIMGATPDTSVTVSSSNISSLGGATAVHVWRGVDTATPIDVTTTTADGINSSNANPPQITPTTSGAVILACGLGTTDETPTAKTLSANMSNAVTTEGTGSVNSAIVGISSVAWTSGAFDPDAWTGGETSGSDSWVAATLALRPASTTNTTNFFRMF